MNAGTPSRWVIAYRWSQLMVWYGLWYSQNIARKIDFFLLVNGSIIAMWSEKGTKNIWLFDWNSDCLANNWMAVLFLVWRFLVCGLLINKLIGAINQTRRREMKRRYGPSSDLINHFSRIGPRVQVKIRFIIYRHCESHYSCPIEYLKGNWFVLLGIGNMLI